MNIQRAIQETVNQGNLIGKLALILLPTTLLYAIPSASASAGTILIYPIAAVLSVFFNGAALVYAYYASQGRTLSLGSAFKQAAGRFLPLLATSLMVFLVVASGLLLFVLPGIYLGVRLAFAACAAAVEDDSPIEALSRSWTLTSGRVWKLFCAALVLMVAVALMGLALGLILGLLGSLFLALTPGDAESLAPLINAAGSLLGGAVGVIYIVVLYRQLSPGVK